jgi:outer membrane protein assembly factor BamA
LEVNTGSEFKIGKGLFGSVNLYCASKPKALRDFGQITDNQGNTTDIYNIVSLPATFDLNLGAGYNIKKNVSFFVQANLKNFTEKKKSMMLKSDLCVKCDYCNFYLQILNKFFLYRMVILTHVTHSCVFNIIKFVPCGIRTPNKFWL